MKKSLREKWTKLYEVSMNIARLKPWKYIVEERVIVVEAYEGLEFYMSVMGMSGLFEGIMLCTSKNAFSSYNEMQSSRIPDLLGINYQEGILMVFNDEKICLEDNVELANEFMPRKIDNKIITFESFVKGYMPSKLTEEELDDAILAFTSLEKTLIEFDKIDTKKKYSDIVKEERDKFLSDRSSALYIKYDEDEDRLDIKADTLNISEFVDALCFDEQLKDKKLAFEKTNHVWEVEFLNNLPIPINEVNYKNPLMNESIKKTQIMRYVIIADRTQGQILHFAPFDKPIMSNEQEHDFRLDAVMKLFECCNTFGKPKEIIVRDRMTYFLLSELLKTIDVKINQNAMLDMCDDFLYGFFEHITGEDMSDFEGMDDEEFEDYLEDYDDEDDDNDNDDFDDDNPFDDDDF